MELEEKTQTANLQPVDSAKRSGRTVIRAKALISVARRATADALNVPVREVDVQIYDDATRLGIQVKAPIKAHEIERCLQEPKLTVFQVAEQARQEIAKHTARITGHDVGSVDLAFTGIVEAEQKKERVQ